MSNKPRATSPYPVARGADGRIAVSRKAVREVRDSVLSFLDVAPVTVDGFSYDNPRTRQPEGLDSIHEWLMDVNRGLYSAMLAIPGVSSHNVRLGVINLLASGDKRLGGSLLSLDQEGAIIWSLCSVMDAHTLSLLLCRIKGMGINNSRTRKLILRSVLGLRSLPHWSVVLRARLCIAVTHALGQSRASALREILSQQPIEPGALVAATRMVGRYVDMTSPDPTTRECLCYILGGDRDFTTRGLAEARTAPKGLTGRPVASQDGLESLELERIRSAVSRSLEGGIEQVMDMAAAMLPDKGGG